MYQVFEKRISTFLQSAPNGLFSNNKIGLEKESLRVAPSGGISQLPHPFQLGSALTHPHITTDYSEALLEFVTPPYTNKTELLTFLTDCQSYVYSKLEDEILWASSMPCVVAGESSIPIAEYGSSNLGKMKSVYRRGLGHRYGRVMQVIAGVHYNYSFSPEFWQFHQDQEKNKESEKDFVASRYFDLIRNFQRYGWLVPYLFGNSPAVCKSFLNGAETDMQDFDDTTYYYPFATSLRLGDIGYQNAKEDESGIRVIYDSLGKYVKSLRHAISTPHAPFMDIGVKQHGNYEQLNSNLLQIENEYYSSVRPKQITRSLEMPVNALQQRGVNYIELRSLDINSYEPTGVNEDSVYFLEAFILFCLLQESPIFNEDTRKQVSRNIFKVAHRGREPNLCIQNGDSSVPLKQWSLEIFDKMQAVCQLLDESYGTSRYSAVLAALKQSVLDPDATPSAQVVAEMRKQKEGFFHFSLRKSLEHCEYFKHHTLSDDQKSFFDNLTKSSMQKQRMIEAEDKIGFDEFLSQYFQQLQT